MSETELWGRTHTDLGNPFDQWIDAAFGPLGGGDGGLRAARTDVQDLGHAFRVQAELPGITREQLKIRIKGAEVEIRGETASTTSEESSRFLYRERRAGGFLRSFELPEPVVGAKAQATLKDGVLTLDLPKEHPETAAVEVPIR